MPKRQCPPQLVLTERWHELLEGCQLTHGVDSRSCGRNAAVATEARLRVLMLTTHDAFGGPFPKLKPLLTRGLRDAGAEVGVLGWGAHTAGAESLLVKIVGRSVDLVRVLRCVRHWRPDVIYVATSHSWQSVLRDTYLAVALTRRGPPLVLHLHGSHPDRLGRPGQTLFTLFSRWLMRRAAAVMLLSTEEQKEWRNSCPNVRFEVVINPFVPDDVVDPNRGARDALGRDSVLLIVARLMRPKGVFELLEALEKVRRSRPCRLVMAGAGPAGDEIAKRAKSLGIDDALEMLGYVTGPTLASAYAGADVFVLPSYQEGFPLSVMEAMANGLPIVTTRIGGCADHLVPDVNAVFVPTRDAQAVAAAIERLLDDDDLRLRMGRANAAKVADFSPDTVMPRYAEILRSVAGTGGLRATS